MGIETMKARFFGVIAGFRCFVPATRIAKHIDAKAMSYVPFFTITNTR